MTEAAAPPRDGRSVEAARSEYRWARYFADTWLCRTPAFCTECGRYSNAVEAAALALDMALAAESDERIRRSIAWA